MLTQRNRLPRRLWARAGLAIIVAGLAVGLLACESEPTPAPLPIPTSTLAPTPTPMPTPTPVPLTAEEILARAAQAVAGLNTAHFELGMTLKGQLPVGDQASIDASGQVSFPDRLQQDMSIGFGMIALKSQLVLIGDTVYVTDPMTGEWRQYQTDRFQGVTLEPGKLVEAMGKGIVSATRFEDGDVDGAATYRVRGSLDPQALPLTGYDMQRFKLQGAEAELWVDKDSFLVRRLAIKADGAVAEGGDVSVDASVVLSRFNEPVTIEAPR